MLTNLTIKNYALIEELEIAFGGGFNTITGETGAGKSILLGALSLVLGKRADLSALRNKESKCIVEANFAIAEYELASFFELNELDYDENTLLRREILPNGKSRAFINDSPVTLSILSTLGGQLVDIHSQHQTLQLADNEFQLKVIDAYADNGKRISIYAQKLKEFKRNQKELEDLVEQQQKATKELDYNSFLFEELNKVKLKPDMQATLESEYEQLNNVENILENLGISNQLVNDEQAGVLSQLSQLKQALDKTASMGEPYNLLLERVSSIAIELDDIASELGRISEDVEPNPERLEEVNSQLSHLNDLMKKHQTSSVEELISIREELEKKVDYSLNIESKIEKQEKLVDKQEAELNTLTTQIRKYRVKIIPALKSSLENSLTNLGMGSASFKIDINPSNEFKPSGKDDLDFLLSANRGSDFGDLKKVASGGELSRIMLVIKSILAEYDNLPTLMFDEIDTGVSGDISTKMGDIMKKMGSSMQIFSITHLPQVAAQGENHYKVYKEEGGEATMTYMKHLNKEERIAELAEMLGGKEIKDSAVRHAEELLRIN